mgnify:CR=1 FL=1
MNVAIAKLIDWVRQSAVPLTGAIIATGFVLFASSGVLEWLGLTSFASDYRPWIALLFIASGALLASQPITWVSNVVGGEFREWFRMRNRVGSLEYLTPPEIDLLQKFIDSQSSTQTLDYSDGVAQGLVRKGYLYRPSSVSRHNTMWDHNLQPWLWKHLQEHPELLGRPPERD